MEGTAYKTIQGLTLTESNYNAAVAMLEDLFGDLQQIISAHMEGLLKVANCVGERSTSLQIVFDKIMIHIRGLEALGVTSEQYGSLLIPVVMVKLPTDIRLRIARETGGKINELLRIVKLEVEAREASEGTSAITTKITPQTPRSSVPPTVSSLIASNRKCQCVYCEDEHFSASCLKVTKIKDQREILLKAGRGFNCLKQHH